MEQTVYSDGEIKDAFRRLDEERQRVRELEKQIEYLKQEKPSADSHIDEIVKLKRLLLILKKKYEDSIRQPSAKDQDGEQAGNAGILAQQVARMKEELIAKQSLLEEIQSKFQRHQEEAQRRIAQFNTALDDAEENAHRYQEQLEKLRAVMLQQKSEAQEQNPHLLETVHQLQLQQTDSQKQIAQLNHILAERQETIRLLKEQCEHLESTAKQQDQMQIEQLRDHQLKSDEQLSQLKIALAEAEENAYRHKVRVEKMTIAIQEKEKKIHELYHFEYSFKKSVEQKNELQLNLDEALKEKEMWQKDVSDLKQHAEQLERVIKFLRERSEEAHLEANQFKEDFSAAQETVEKLQKEIEQYQEQIARSHHVHTILEQEKVDLTEETKLLQGQLEILRQRVQQAEMRHEQQIHSLQESDAHIEQLVMERDELKRLLDGKTNALNLLENDVLLVKQTLVRAVREGKELEAHYLESVQEKIAALNKFHQVCQQLDRQQGEFIHLHEQFEESKNHFHTLLLQAEESRSTLERQNKAIVHELEEKLAGAHAELEIAAHNEIEKEALQKMSASLKINLDDLQIRYEEQERTTSFLKNELEQQIQLQKQKEQELLSLQEKWDLSQQELQQVRQQLQQMQTECADADSNLKIAQQHLAKKIREATLLTEKIEEQKLQLHELQVQQTHWQTRIGEQQQALDSHYQQEKRLQDQLHDALRESDLQIKRWEEKYFQVVDQWQAVERRNKELEKLEEKHQQVQHLLTNLGSFFGGPSAAAPVNIPDLVPAASQEPPSLPAPQQRQTTSAVKFGEEAFPEDGKVTEPSRPYQNLFDMPKGPNKMRENLFD